MLPAQPKVKSSPIMKIHPQLEEEMEKESWKEIQIEDTGTERDNVLAKV